MEQILKQIKSVSIRPSKNIFELQILKGDPRWFQILTLSSLMLFLMNISDYAPQLPILIVSLLSAFLFQFLCFAHIQHKAGLLFAGTPTFETVKNGFWRVLKKTDYKSPAISALSLVLLIKANVLWIHPIAALIAIAGKFYIRVNDKHIFNPTNLSIVLMLPFFTDFMWISPAQWGHALWFFFFFGSFAVLVLYKIPKGDISLFFLGSYALLLVGHALFLGNPLSIPLHKLQSGAIILFSFFMITDPKTTPDSRTGRLVFAVTTAILAFILQFVFPVKGGLFVALALVSLTTPLIDKFKPGQRFEWSSRL